MNDGRVSLNGWQIKLLDIFAHKIFGRAPLVLFDVFAVFKRKKNKYFGSSKLSNWYPQIERLVHVAQVNTAYSYPVKLCFILKNKEITNLC